MFTLLVFIVVLALLVLAHEAGHFFVARRAGVRVDEFGFGFPPRLFGVYRDPHSKKFVFVGPRRSQKIFAHEHKQGEHPEKEHAPYHEFPATVYSVNVLPLGGFVKIKGEEGEHKNHADSFASKKAWVRSIILSAGVVMNVFVAAVLLSIGFMIGIPAALGGELPKGATVTDQAVGVIEVLPDSPAAQAGVQPGDAIMRVNDEAVTNQDDAFAKISSAAVRGAVQIEIKRGKEIKIFTLQPTVITEIGRPAIGVALVDTGLVSLPWYRAIPEGVKATGVFLWEIVRSLAGIVIAIFRGAPVTEQLSGPVGIAVMTGQAARLGLSYLMQFTALLSLNLAFINILPIPALDGGRLLFVAIEKLRRGKAVPQYVERWMHMVGLALLLLLVIAVTAKDIGRLF
ncbi:MAG: RIP metalloprotease RseP [Patescibacteria group bacterium]